MREKVGKWQNTVFFQWFGAPEGRKVHAVVARSTFRSQNVKNTRVRTTFGSWDVEKVYAVVARSTFRSQNVQNTGFRTTFGTWDVEKVHAAVAQSTFRSQNVQNTSDPDHFWKLRCRKSACRCGAKHISKAKCTKHTMLGPLLEVEMSKKCRPWWRKAHFQGKMYKTHHVRTIFGSSDVEKVDAGVGRSTFPSQNVQNTPCSHVRTIFGGSDVVSRGKRKGLWTLSKVSKTSGFCSIFNHNHHYTTLHDAPIHYTTLQLQLQLHLHYILLPSPHYITLHYLPLHYITLHNTPLHYTSLHYITLHDTTFHYTSLHYTTLHSTTLQLQLQLHSTTLDYTKLYYSR